MKTLCARFSWIVVGFLFVSQCKAQSPEIPEDLSSMIADSTKENESEEAKFDRYISIARKSLNINRTISKNYSLRALDLASSSKNPIWAAKGYSNLAVAYLYEGKYKSSDSVLGLALKVIPENHPESKIIRSQVYINLGNRHLFTAQYDSAIYHYNKVIDLLENNDDGYEDLGKALNNKAAAYLYQAKYQTSLITFFDAIKVSEKIPDSNLLSMQHGNIANIYHFTEQYQKAINHGKKGYDIADAAGNNYAASAILLTIGGAYEQMDVLDSALYYANKAEKLKKVLNDMAGVANANLNIGAVKLKQNKLPEAKLRFERSLELFEQLQKHEGISMSKASLGRVYMASGQAKKGEQLIKEALELAEEKKIYTAIREIYYSAGNGYAATGQFKNAFNYIMMHKNISDSIRIATNLEALDELETIYETDKQKNLIANLEKDQKLKDLRNQKNKAKLKQEKLESEKQRQRSYLLFGGLAVALIFGGVVLNRFRVTKRQNKIIEEQKSEVETQRDIADKQREIAEEQKHKVEEKNREITDSINYAKRLQEAILPSLRQVKESLPESFILYKPKDIIAGDFYWMETINDQVYFAAADCTGHGVPGAMVSVVCSNALTKSLIEEGISSPAEILDRTRELVIEQFQRGEEEIKDGMDISLCALNTKTGELTWAGANNPLWIVRKGDNNVEEIKADKQPIGKYGEQKPFTNHRISLLKGDAIYLFSDGYPDQFGGEKGKKYKSGKMKKFVLSVSSKPMEEQEQILSEEFESWRGDIEQIDDVCVIGVRC